MNDDDFERIRDALSPAREQTTRLGGLFVLESMLDDDDRITSLVATLLLDRDGAVAGGAAALAYRTRLALSLHEELHKAWGNAPVGYRDALLEHASAATLDELLSYFLSAKDAGLRMRYLTRLRAEGSERKIAFAALELARDDESELRRVSAEMLGGVDDEDAPGCLALLLDDDDENVKNAALKSFVTIAPLEHAVAATESWDEGEAKREALGIVRARQNEAVVVPLISRQKVLVDEGRYDEALALAAQVFMRVVNHAECQYQMARATAGLGDGRRALRLLVNAFEGGYDGAAEALRDPLFERMRAEDEWADVIALANGA